MQIGATSHAEVQRLKAKKWLTGLVSGILAVSLLSGCVPKASQPKTEEPKPAAKPDEPITLEFWTINLKKNFEAYITQTIDGYKQVKPNVTINWIDVPGAEVDTKLLAAIAGGSAPDVVNIASPSLYKFEGALADLSQHVTAAQMGEYFDNLVASTKQNGKQVAIPWYYGGPPIGYWNEELIKQAGLDPSKPPKTVDEAFAMGKQIHEKTGLYGSNYWASSLAFQMEGIELLTPDKKKAAFNTPEAEAMVQKYLDAYKSGATAAGAITTDIRNLPQNMENEQTAMSLTSGAFGLNNIEKNAKPVFDKLKLYPSVVGKSGKLPLVSGIQTFVVPARSKHPKEAAEFALFFTNAQNQLAFCKLVAIFPSTKKTLEDPFFTDIKVEKLQDEARKIMLADLPKVVDGTLGTPIDKALRDILDEEMRAVYLEKKSIKQALSDAEKAWNAKLAEAK